MKVMDLHDRYTTTDYQPHILPSGVMWHYATISSQHTYTSASSLLSSTWPTHAACSDMQVLWTTIAEGGPYLRQPYPAGQRYAQISSKPQSWSLHGKHENGLRTKLGPKCGRLELAAGPQELDSMAEIA